MLEAFSSLESADNSSLTLKTESWYLIWPHVARQEVKADKPAKSESKGGPFDLTTYNTLWNLGCNKENAL